MNYEVVNKFPIDEFMERVRQVPLMKPGGDGNPIYVYRNANISLKRLTAGEVNPPTFYLLTRQMEIQRSLRSFLQTQGIDSLNLENILEIKNDAGEIWTFTPPIIEVSQRTVTYVPQGGEIDHSQTPVTVNIPLVCDGAHRVALARELGKEFTSLFISGIDPSFAYYAHPNNWDMVRLMDKVPATMEEKKLYRFKDSYSLYRNFGVLGCGVPRKTS